MKQFFFGVALLGFVLSLFALAWQYESNQQLKQEILALKEQSDQILQQQMRQKQTVEKDYALQIGSLKSTVNALGASVNQNQTKVSLIELEKLYKSGEKSFLYSCTGMKGLSSKELFEKPYFADLSQALKKVQPEMKGEPGITMNINFPWVSSESLTVFAVCEDTSDVYVFSGYSPNIHSMFFGVGKFSLKTKTMSFESTASTFLYLKEIVKEKDVIRFVSQDICFADEQSLVGCDDPKALQPLQKLPQSQVNYNVLENIFAVVNP